MKVKVDTAKKMLMEIYHAKGAAPHMAEWLTELSLEQDLTGNYFSGLEDGPEGIYGNLSSDIHETFEVDKPSLKLINGNGKPPKLIMKDLLPKAIGWAHEQGQVFIGFKNTGYHGSMGTIVRKFAEANLVAIYSANGGPSTVPPYGGSQELLGTNPIAYGIPTSDMPIVFDAATSERPWGSMGKARERHEKLQPDTYFDVSGEYTTDPFKSVAIIPFGGHKGYAINLMLDVLTGALVGAKTGSLVGDDVDIGGFLILIDPAVFGPLDTFISQMDQVVKDILINRPAKGFDEIRVPGFRSQKLKEQQLKSGDIEVEDVVWKKFTELHRKVVS